MKYITILFAFLIPFSLSAQQLPVVTKPVVLLNRHTTQLKLDNSCLNFSRVLPSTIKSANTIQLIHVAPIGKNTLLINNLDRPGESFISFSTGPRTKIIFPLGFGQSHLEPVMLHRLSDNFIIISK